MGSVVRSRAMFSLTTLIPLFLLLVRSSALDGVDPCTVSRLDFVSIGHDSPVKYEGLNLGTYAIKTVSQMRKCLEQFPFLLERAKLTTNATRHLLGYYSFLHTNLDSGPPYNLKYDLMHQIQALEEKAVAGAFQFEYQFHHALQAIFVQNRDGHTKYRPPQGSANGYTVLHPLRLYGKKMSEAKLGFYVKGDISYGVHDATHPDLTPIATQEYRDWEVASIDGMDPLEYFKMRANRFPRTKDPSLNFNMELFHSFNYHNVQELPGADFITFEVVSPAGIVSEIQVGYLVTDAGSPTSARIVKRDNTLVMKNCDPISLSRNVEAIASVGDDGDLISPRAMMDELLHAVSDHLELKPSSELAGSLRRTVHPSADTKLLIVDKATRFSLASYKESTLILTLPSFSALPIIPPSKGGTFWLAPFDFISKYGSKYDRLIIDVRDNTGGYACLGRAMAALFTGETQKQSANDHDIELTDMFKSFPINTNVVIDGTSRTLWDVIKNDAPVHKKRGGVDVTTTPLYSLGCERFFDGFSSRSIEIPFNNSDIIVLTDGLSISTASIFVKSVVGKLPIVGFGGIPNEPMAASWSVGGPVITSYSKLLNGLVDGSCVFARKGIFPTFPDSGDIAMSYATQYEPHSTTLPGEFVRDEPDYRLDFWDDLNNDVIYEATLEAVLGKE